MRHIIGLGFLITSFVLYYHAYLGEERGVLGALTVLWWVSAGLATLFALFDILNARIGNFITYLITLPISAWIFFFGVLNFQPWALAIEFWVAAAGIGVYALSGVISVAILDAEGA